MFAVLHIADFALQALLRCEAPGLGAEAGLIDPEARPPRLVAATAAARARGVAPGQTGAQALARCGSLRILTRRADAEEEAAAGLLAAAFSLSPAVEQTGPGVCTVQVDGLRVEQRRPALESAVDRLAQLGLAATAGVASTPLLALYAARVAGPVLVVDGERDFLAGLPLEAAAPPAGLAEILAGWGVRTLGGLTALPKAAVSGRLGPEGVALWERAAGEVTRPLRLVVPPAQFVASMECEHELETLEPLLFLLRRFVDRLALELQNAAQAAAVLRLRLDLADETTLAHELRLPEPSTQPDLLFAALHTWLESARTSAGIVAVRLEAVPTRIAARQHGLFDRALRDSHRFAETLARVSALVGADRAGTPVACDTHRPDAFRLVAPAPEISPLEARGFRPPARGLVLRRFRPLVPALVEFDEDQTPRAFSAGAIGGRIMATAGPWRASGDWWEKERTWRREEWDVETGGLYRLVRTPAGWFLEGEYD